MSVDVYEFSTSQKDTLQQLYDAWRFLPACELMAVTGNAIQDFQALRSDNADMLAETASLREQLKVAVGALEGIASNEHESIMLTVYPSIDSRAHAAKQALAQIKALQPSENNLEK